MFMLTNYLQNSFNDIVHNTGPYQLKIYYWLLQDSLHLLYVDSAPLLRCV